MPFESKSMSNGHGRLKRPNENEFLHTAVKHTSTSTCGEPRYLLVKFLYRLTVAIIAGFMYAGVAVCMYFYGPADKSALQLP